MNWPKTVNSAWQTAHRMTVWQLIPNQERKHMSIPYIPRHILQEARDLRHQGHSIQGLAPRIGITAEDLAKLLGEPQWRTIPAEPVAGTDICRTPEAFL